MRNVRNRGDSNREKSRQYKSVGSDGFMICRFRQIYQPTQENRHGSNQPVGLDRILRRRFKPDSCEKWSLGGSDPPNMIGSFIRGPWLVVLSLKGQDENMEHNTDWWAPSEEDLRRGLTDEEILIRGAQFIVGEDKTLSENERELAMELARQNGAPHPDWATETPVGWLKPRSRAVWATAVARRVIWERR